MAQDFEFQKEEEGAPDWIVTFADMMSLLLTFFVLMLSFAVMDAEKFKAAADSMREAFSFTALPIPGKVQEAASGESTPATQSTVTPALNHSEQISPLHQDVRKATFQKIKQYIDSYIDREKLGATVQTKLTDKGLIIVNSDPLSFPSGKANLEPNSIRYLEALLPVLAETDFDIMIEGHTDDRPIETTEFPSNWELSTARASRFARYLVDRGVKPNRLSVHGYAEFQPVAPNDTEESRAKNRRIEILMGYGSKQE